VPTAGPQQLGLEELRLEVPSGHELDGRETVTIQEIAGLPMVALRPGYGLHHVVDRLFYEAGQNARITIEATELSTLRALGQQGNGVVGIVPTPTTNTTP
jgi:DNA-binding transcriptional LysR family regulator